MCSGKFLSRSKHFGRDIRKRMSPFCGEGVILMDESKTNFVEKIGGTTFIVNAMSAEDAKHTQEEVVKAMIAREAMTFSDDAA